VLVTAVLRNEFSRRARENPNYSLRAFARYLKVSHSLLSLVLNNHREPSARFVATISERLRFSPEKAALMHQSLKKHPQAAPATKVNQLTLDQFALISEWQHYAILSLLEVPGTELIPSFVASRLNISPMLAKVSIERLKNLGLVKKGSDGKWKQSSEPIVIENKISTSWTRKFQRQLLIKAIQSLETDPIEFRDFSSITFAMHPKHVEFALKKIREFRRQLVHELEAFGDPKEVYNLTVQIFPVSRRSKV